MAYKPKTTLKDVMTEAQVQKFLEVNSDQLKDLRNKKDFPYISVTATKRMYYASDVVNWLRSNRQNIPQN